MLIIKNKSESVEKMKELKLNYFPLEVFDKNDVVKMKEFFQKYPSPEYAIRSTDKAKGKFFFVTCFEELLPLLENFEKNVTISVSYNPYKNNIILVGDIKVVRGEDVEIDLTARSDSEATHRNIYENPEYNIHASIVDEELWNIEGFSTIMKYITDYNLYECVVEFAVYNCEIGINKENVVISEIRTGY